MGSKGRENSICKGNKVEGWVWGGQWYRWEEVGPEAALICGCFDVSARLLGRWLNPVSLGFFTSSLRNFWETGVSYVDAWH